MSEYVGEPAVDVEYRHHFEGDIFSDCAHCGGRMPAKCTGPRQAPNLENRSQ